MCKYISSVLVYSIPGLYPEKFMYQSGVICKTVHSDVVCKKRWWDQSLSTTRVMGMPKVVEYFASVRSSNDNMTADQTVLSEENKTK